MTTVSGTVQQTNEYGTYTAGSCACGQCSAFTKKGSCGNNWWLGDTSCCGGFCQSQPKCSLVDPAVCPAIGNATASVEWDPARKAPIVRCNYNSRDFVDAAQVQQFINKFGDGAAGYNPLMQHFCALPSSERCVIDPLTGKPFTTCANFLSDGLAGNLCTQWALNHPTDANIAMENYCRSASENLTNRPDCRCIRRSLLPIYRDIGHFQAFSDACWWKPCQNPASYLVPFEPQYRNPNCPTTVCQEVVNIVDSENINLNDVRQNISCNVGPGPSNGGGSVVVSVVIAGVLLAAVATALFLLLGR